MYVCMYLFSVFLGCVCLSQEVFWPLVCSRIPKNVERIRSFRTKTHSR